MPNAALADMPAQVALALSLASSNTGADYDYLVKTARSESSFQAEAKAPTSSAQGLFQFIEETWIRTIKDEGEKFGLGTYAALITKTETGRYIVSTPADRAAILALRKNPKISAMMAGAYARRNADYVASEIGRQPTSDELYIAHFLGPADAAKLITYRDRQPYLSAPDMFPAAAKANRTIFFSDSGARSIGQVYDLLVARQQLAGAAPADDGAFFSGKIDFGSWSPTIEMELPAAAKTKPHPQLASADGISLFDYLAGKGKAPATAAPTATPAEANAGTNWSAEVNQPAQTAAPYITVADDYSLGQGDDTTASIDPTPAAAPAQPAVRPLMAEAEAPRFKIIHVPAK